MRLILFIAFACLLGYGVLQLGRIDPDNYVAMYLGGYVVELKVVQLLVLVLLLVVVLYFSLWLLRTIWRSPKSMSRWWHRRGRNISEEQFGAGYLSLIKGDWRRAETQLTKKTKHSHISYVNYLAAARAAAEQGRLSQRDSYLQAAYQAAPKERLAIGLTKARLHERAGQVEEAQATLDDLRDLGASNPQYTAMSLQLFERNNNWEAVESILPAAQKQRALPAEMLTSLQDKVVTHKLAVAQDTAGAFKALPRAQRKSAKNVFIYAQDLLSKGDHGTAEKVIRAALKADWSDELVDLYGQLVTDNPKKQLRQAEGWLMARPENAHLNLAAGRLAKLAKSYDVATEYLQAAIKHGNLAGAYSTLGEVYEANNESSKALQLYRVGMQSMAGETPKQLQDKRDSEKSTASEKDSKDSISGEIVESGN